MTAINCFENIAGFIRIDCRAINSLWITVDVSNSPQDDPNPAFGIWISEGESNLPNFRFLNVSGEAIFDPVIYLEGYKIRVTPLSRAKVEEMRATNGGKLHYKIITDYGLPHAGTMQDDFAV